MISQSKQCYLAHMYAMHICPQYLLLSKETGGFIRIYLRVAWLIFRFGHFHLLFSTFAELNASCTITIYLYMNQRQML